MVFPIYDHIFHYYFPFNNSDQKAILRNPFKEIKTLKLLSSMVISNKNIMLALDEDTHDFYFNINNENNTFNDDFIIFFYSDEEKTKLYLTWKIEIEWLELFNVKYKGKIGSKLASIIRINYKVEPYNEVGYAANSITLQLFSNYPDTIIFPQDSKIPFTIKPNSLEDKKFFIYPRKDEGNLAIINCVNIYTRDLHKSWIIKYEIDNPQIDDSEIIECIYDDCKFEYIQNSCPMEGCSDIYTIEKNQIFNNFPQGILSNHNDEIIHQKINCFYCWRPIVYPSSKKHRNKYYECQLVKCPYKGCNKSFNRIICPFCFYEIYARRMV